MKPEQCKRPYDLRKRHQSAVENRNAALDAAKRILKHQGFLQFTMASVAKESGLTRQTIHNLFGGKLELIEALFDELAASAGMERMRSIMQSANSVTMAREYLMLMVGLWLQDRVLIRRIHGLRAIDPELGAALERRNQRKNMAITKIVNALEKNRPTPFRREERQHCLSIFYAFTSTAVYELLAESLGSEREVANAVLNSVGRALNLDLPPVNENEVRSSSRSAPKSNSPN